MKVQADLENILLGSLSFVLTGVLAAHCSSFITVLINMQLMSQGSERCVSEYSECAVLDTEPGLTYARQVLSHRVHLQYLLYHRVHL